MCELFDRFETATFPDPLILERDDGDGYLETLLRVVDGDIHVSHHTKIDLGALVTTGDTLLRLHTYKSFCPKQLLYGVLVGTLCRCLSNTSHGRLLEGPVRAVIAEFELLEYPMKVCLAAMSDVAIKRQSNDLSALHDKFIGELSV